MKWLEEHGFRQAGDWWRHDVGSLSVYVRETPDGKWICNLIDFSVSASVTEKGDSSEDAVMSSLEKLKKGAIRLENLIQTTQSVLRDGISFEEVGRAVHE